MQPSLDTRRHNDGSIDFDFYRRRAARRRRLAKRLVVKHCLTAIGRAAKASVSAMARLTTLLSAQRGDLRPILRVGAASPPSC
jgi:hypothetical protein